MVRTAVQREQRNNNDGCAAAFEEVIVRTVASFLLCTRISYSWFQWAILSEEHFPATKILFIYLPNTSVPRDTLLMIRHFDPPLIKGRPDEERRI
jgi:hypothetical protein